MDVLELKTCEEEEWEQRMKNNGEEKMNEGAGELGQNKKVVPVLVNDRSQSGIALQCFLTDCDQSVKISDTYFF